MQSTIHVSSDQEVDAHAPASTYYTTGLNAGGHISRLKNYTVSLSLIKKNIVNLTIYI
jgi:alpha,alpha-trehalase